MRFHFILNPPPPLVHVLKLMPTMQSCLTGAIPCFPPRMTQVGLYINFACM